MAEGFFCLAVAPLRGLVGALRLSRGKAALSSLRVLVKESNGALRGIIM